jgi:hypothetical protein
MSNGIIWLEWEYQDPAQLPVGLVFPTQANHFHITLQFGVPRNVHLEQTFGSRLIQVPITGNCYNHRIQALSVALPEEIAPFCRNSRPHMTLSMANGVRPVESNQMLEDPSATVDPIFATTLNFRLSFHSFNHG